MYVLSVFAESPKHCLSTISLASDNISTSSSPSHVVGDVLGAISLSDPVSNNGMLLIFYFFLILI